MTPAEFDAVGLGWGRVSEALRPWFLAGDARLEALFKQVPKAKRQQVRDMFWAEKEKLDAARPKWKPYYWNVLWTEPIEDRLVTATDIAADERKLVASARAMGCRCAKEGMAMNCESCEGWMGKAGKA
jgi:hypothetical protein